jgi:hypothetical protein
MYKKRDADNVGTTFPAALTIFLPGLLDYFSPNGNESCLFISNIQNCISHLTDFMYPGNDLLEWWCTIWP